jgi:sugar lactone lactonase YvrE
MAALNGNTILMADSFLGGIWGLYISTGIKKLVFTDSSMNGTATVATGINGIRVRPGWLYFTSSAKGTFNRIAIDLKTGEKAEQSRTISSSLSGPDDFEIDDDAGVAYVCNGAADEILRITLSGGRKRAIAKIPGPTSARWNVDQTGKVLYVSDVGGLAQYVEHNVALGGAIYGIDL